MENTVYGVCRLQKSFWFSLTKQNQTTNVMEEYISKIYTNSRVQIKQHTLSNKTPIKKTGEQPIKPINPMLKVCVQSIKTGGKEEL